MRAPAHLSTPALAEEVVTLANALSRLCAAHTPEAVYIALGMVFGAGLSDEDDPEEVVAGFRRVALHEVQQNRGGHA